MSESEEPRDDRPEPESASPKLVRPPAVWPLALIVAVQFAAMIVPGQIAPGTILQFFGMMIGGAGGALLIAVWWFTRMKLPLGERFVGFALYAAVVGACVAFCLHPSMAGMPVILYVLPSLCLVLVPLLAVAHVTGWRIGRLGMLAGVVAMLAVWTGVRAEGLDGSLSAKFVPRWEKTAEEVFLADAAAEPAAEAAEAIKAVVAAPDDWTGFRGSSRDGRLVGQTIADDWSGNPPTELWRRKVGPGWGSFTIVGGLLFTQEQRGEQEVVACYDAATGEPRWINEAASRFEETVAGPGPRATPTFDNGRLYTTGASGVVQCLDAATGEAIWRRDLTEDTSAEVVEGSWWGFASSPLVVEIAEDRSVAIVYAGTPHPREPDAPPAGDSVIAYDTATGEPAWKSGVGTHGYVSPHLATIAGVEQVLVPSNEGLESLLPATGERLWFYEWSATEFPRIVQPALLPGDRVVLATGYGFGTHSIAVKREEDAWATDTLWESKKLKPYFNDLVYYEGHLYGFDGKFFTCLNAETGEVTWPRSVKRKAAFGHGQALLVDESGLIVLVTETTGEIVLIEANPETLVVRGRIEALEGKTWNHPVIHGGRLYVRNGVEMACYELPKAADSLAVAP